MELLEHDEGHDEGHEDEHGAPAPPTGGKKAKFGTGADAGAPGSPADKAKKQHRDNMLLIAVAVVGVIVTFLIYRSNKAAAASAGTTNPVSTTGTVAGSSGSASDPYTQSMVESLGQQETANASALQGLGTLLGNLQTEVSGLGSGPGPAGTNPATQTPTGPSAVSGLNWADFAKDVTYQQLQGEPGAYTPIGYFSQAGGQGYVGAQATGGAPVYAGIFGGLYQGGANGFASVPAGTELYIPSYLKGNEQGTAATGPGASGYTALGQT
jgi:hypothetical protein